MFKRKPFKVIHGFSLSNKAPTEQDLKTTTPDILTRDSADRLTPFALALILPLGKEGDFFESNDTTVLIPGGI